MNPFSTQNEINKKNDEFCNIKKIEKYCSPKKMDGNQCKDIPNEDSIRKSLKEDFESNKDMNLIDELDGIKILYKSEENLPIYNNEPIIGNHNCFFRKNKSMNENDINLCYDKKDENITGRLRNRVL